MEYSTDTTNWTAMDTSTSISLANVGDKVYIRGILSTDNTKSKSSKFKMSGKIAASGNCNALWNYQDLEAPLKAYCGGRIFEGCSSLTSAPWLPATTLSIGCYYNMFRNCTSLISAPELPATTLPTYCYQYMFYGCTSLTVAPELHATKLDGGCYEGMFINCTSLVTAPELPATTLVSDCYNSMFKNCTNLNYIKCLATDLPIGGGTYNWVTAVSSTGTFIKHPDMNSWTTGTSGIPSGWTVIDAVL